MKREQKKVIDAKRKRKVRSSLRAGEKDDRALNCCCVGTVSLKTKDHHPEMTVPTPLSLVCVCLSPVYDVPKTNLFSTPNNHHRYHQLPSYQSYQYHRKPCVCLLRSDPMRLLSDPPKKEKERKEIGMTKEKGRKIYIHTHIYIYIYIEIQKKRKKRNAPTNPLLRPSVRPLDSVSICEKKVNT